MGVIDALSTGDRLSLLRAVEAVSSLFEKGVVHKA